MSSLCSRRGGMYSGKSWRREYNSARKTPACTIFSKSRLRRGDNARLRCPRLGAAHPLKRAFFQQAQDLVLRFQRHLADFIQKERAVLWPCSTLPNFANSSISLLVFATKEFTVDQGLGLRPRS